METPWRLSWAGPLPQQRDFSSCPPCTSAFAKHIRLFPGKPRQKERTYLGGCTFWRVNSRHDCPGRVLTRVCVTLASPWAQEPPPRMGPDWHLGSTVGTWWPALAFHGHPWLEFCPGRTKAAVPIPSSRASQPPRGRLGCLRWADLPQFLQDRAGSWHDGMAGRDGQELWLGTASPSPLHRAFPSPLASGRELWRRKMGFLKEK